jgi:hypothetical protein
MAENETDSEKNDGEERTKKKFLSRYRGPTKS